MRTLLCLALGLCLVGVSDAQTIRDLKPFRRLVAPRPTTIDTNQFVPQVDPGYSLKTIRPEHDAGFIPPTLDFNTLAVGENTTENNVSLPGAKFPAIDATGWTPPDPDIAVGPDHVVVVVNSSIAFFDKPGGRKTLEQTFAAFFSSVPGVTSFLFDPKAFYDPISKRFFVYVCEQAGTGSISKGLIAVSDDTNPAGRWNLYRVETKQTAGGADYWLDYPGWGFNKDAIIVTGNMFGFTSGYNGIQYIVIPKAPLLTGAQPTISYLGTGGGTAHPARTIDANLDRAYFVNFASNSQANLGVITNLTGTPALSQTQVNIPTWIGPTPSDSTNGHQLDGLDGRTMNAFWRAGRLVFTHTARPSQSELNASRWYEINTNNYPAGNPSLVQAGQVKGSSGQFMSMPAITSNSKGDIGMVFARSSSSITMDFMAAGRKRTDPVGTMGAPKLLATSEGNSYGGAGVNRFGDYFGIGVDPKDDTTFWGVGMIARSDGGWRTVVNSFQITLPGGSSGGTIYPATAIQKVTGNQVFGTLPNVTTSNDAYFTVTSTSVQRTGQVSAAAATFTVNRLGNQFATLDVNFESAAAIGVSSSVFAWNWSTGLYDYIGAVSSPSLDSKATVKLPAASIAKYVSSTRQVRVQLRAISPIGTNRNPIPFNYRLDLVQLIGTLK